jgi:hypothetical protein
MKRKIYSDIAEGILRTVYSHEIVYDKDFKRLAERRRHRYANIYKVRNILMDRGIVGRLDKGYVLIPGCFVRRSEILQYVKFLKGNDPGLWDIGVRGLHDIYARRAAPEVESVEEFLQQTSVKALIEGRDVREVTQIREVWEVFIEVLGDDDKCWLLKNLVKTIQGAIDRVKDLGKMGLPITGPKSKLNKELVRSVSKAILVLTSSECYLMYEKIVIKLLCILRDLDDEEKTRLLRTLKDLLKRPCQRTNFSTAEKPTSDGYRRSKEQTFNDIWHAPEGYTDLFNACYTMLEKLGKERMRTILLNWITHGDNNLRSGAQMLLSHYYRVKTSKR